MLIAWSGNARRRTLRTKIAKLRTDSVRLFLHAGRLALDIEGKTKKIEPRGLFLKDARALLSSRTREFNKEQ